jgi:N-acetylmuramic acid 6-phosphate etherase
MSELSYNYFTKVAKEFSLGDLTTESFHPKTKNLSDLVKKDLAQAIDLLYSIDKDALAILETKLTEIYQLKKDINETLDQNGRVFLSGCGATGRLSIALETFYRQHTNKDNVIGFMAGGDYALIKSVESFEDERDYGIRQTKELGFTENDLMLAITEGGETTFVIACCEYAAEHSKRKPYFLYCNPDSELEQIQRSKAIIENSKINKLNLTIGPMALAGSTRMQATTVQMLTVAFALFIDAKDEDHFIQSAKEIIHNLQNLNLSGLENVISKEANIYQNHEIITYISDKESAMTILTDTTERSPTFSLAPFEKLGEDHFSLSYLTIANEKDNKLAWEHLLSRKPRCLDWGLSLKTDLEELYKFDISAETLKRRSKGAETQHKFKIYKDNKHFHFEIDELKFSIAHKQEIPVFQEIALKMILNTHSTLLMGLLERYERNMMTYVKPSNLKLIDRAMRYIKELLPKGQHTDDEILIVLFEERTKVQTDEAIVLRVVERLKS